MLGDDDMSNRKRSMLPALAYHRLTSLYDLVVSRLLAEQEWKIKLVGEVAPRPGDVVVDLGSGTGTLAMMLKAACPAAEIHGVEPDRKMIELAQEKARMANLAVAFHQHFADELPFAAGFATKVVSSLVFHHLDRKTKRASLEAAHRVLRSGGQLHICDWTTPDNPLMRLAYLQIQLLDGFATTDDNRRGLLPFFMREAGFVEVIETYRRKTLFGNLGFFSGTASPHPHRLQPGTT